MSESAREALCALMDGEASELELRRVLAAVDDDPELLQRWRRYHLARDALTASAAAPMQSIDISAAVATAIREHGPSAVSAPAAVAGWRRSLASFAVAASVTAVVVFGARQLESLGGSGAEAVRAVAPVGLVNSQGGVPVQASYGSSALPASAQRLSQSQPLMQPPLAPDAARYRELARQRLLMYSQQHAEHAALNTPQGMIPYARVPEIKP